ncbi:MAG TPA: lyase family protein, partial [Pseudomonadales bacterium]
MKTRTEYDSLGPVDVPADALWGAQTQRSLHFFAIGEERFSAGFIDAFVTVKQAAARANRKLGKLAAAEQQWIEAACIELKSGRYWQQFPLSVWQTGSGTQTNMNVNEVIAHLANRLAGSEPGSKTPIHPNDHVNLSQSSNDVFPAVMHVASLLAVRQQLLPALARLIGSLHEKQQQFAEHIKSGRTHLMDATPVTLGQEFSAYAAQLQYGKAQIVEVLPQLAKLALGGSAVGTGLNTHPQWAATVTGCISELAGETFVPA